MRYDSSLTKVFISYHHRNDQWAKEHLVKMGSVCGCFKDGSVNTGDIADDGRSSQAIREKIRDEYLRDTEVTVLLCGEETKGRKHVDWELKSSMISTRYNSRSGILVIMLPSVDTGNWYTSMSGEKQAIYPDYPAFGGGWFTVDKRSDFESRWPALPTRIIDNLLKPEVQISVVQWDRIANNPQKLKWLIDNAAAAARHNRYDMSRPMRRNNSPLKGNGLASLFVDPPQPPKNGLGTLLAQESRPQENSLAALLSEHLKK